jgi:hypothetical protein
LFAGCCVQVVLIFRSLLLLLLSSAFPLSSGWKGGLTTAAAVALQKISDLEMYQSHKITSLLPDAAAAVTTTMATRTTRTT